MIKLNRRCIDELCRYYDITPSVMALQRKMRKLGVNAVGFDDEFQLQFSCPQEETMFRLKHAELLILDDYDTNKDYV